MENRAVTGSASLDMVFGFIRRHARLTLAAGTLAAGVSTVSLTPIAPVGAAASPAGSSWACVASGPGHETSVRLPRTSVDALVARTRSYRGPCAEYGDRVSVGDGTLTAFSQRTGNRPVAVGLIMTGSSLDGLPSGSSYARQLALSPAFRRDVDSPFTYVLANWNPGGELPTQIPGVPQYDVGFYLSDNADPPPAAGTPGQRLARTQVYGAWTGDSTSYQIMVTRSLYIGLRDGAGPSGCYSLKLPGAWRKSGWYPTKYCLASRPNRGEIVTSLEDFVYRAAS